MDNICCHKTETIKPRCYFWKWLLVLIWVNCFWSTTWLEKWGPHKARSMTLQKMAHAQGCDIDMMHTVWLEDGHFRPIMAAAAPGICVACLQTHTSVSWSHQATHNPLLPTYNQKDLIDNKECITHFFHYCRCSCLFTNKMSFFYYWTLLNSANADTYAYVP